MIAKFVANTVSGEVLAEVVVDSLTQLPAAGEWVMIGENGYKVAEREWIIEHIGNIDDLTQVLIVLSI